MFILGHLKQTGRIVVFFQLVKKNEESILKLNTSKYTNSISTFNMYLRKAYLLTSKSLKHWHLRIMVQSSALQRWYFSSDLVVTRVDNFYWVPIC